MQKARRHSEELRPLVGARFQVLFHSLIQSTFHLSLTVLVHYRSLRSIQPYQMVLADSRRISPVPRYSGYHSSTIISTYGAITHVAQLSRWFSLRLFSKCGPTTPKEHAPTVQALPCSLATTQGIIRLFSFPPGTQMFQFSGLAPFRVICLQHIRLSHSEIFGLSIVCIYPKLIAAYHVLHRLSMPRHPPCALIRFKYCWY